MEGKKVTCIVCPNSCKLEITLEENEYKVKGNLCKRGKEFAINEVTDPKRSLCTTVKTNFNSIPRLSVRTDGEVPKKYIKDIMKELSSVIVEKPVKINEVIVENILNTGINIIATANIKCAKEGGNSYEH